MGDLFDFQDEEHELSQLVAGAVDEDKCGHTGDSAHVGPETGSQPTGIKRGREKTSAKNSKRVVCRKGAARHLKRVEAGEPMLLRYSSFHRLPANRLEKRNAQTPKNRAHVLWSCGLTT